MRIYTLELYILKVRMVIDLYNQPYYMGNMCNIHNTCVLIYLNQTKKEDLFYEKNCYNWYWKLWKSGSIIS